MLLIAGCRTKGHFYFITFPKMFKIYKKIAIKNDFASSGFNLLFLSITDLEVEKKYLEKKLENGKESRVCLKFLTGTNKWLSTSKQLALLPKKYGKTSACVTLSSCRQKNISQQWFYSKSSSRILRAIRNATIINPNSSQIIIINRVLCEYYVFTNIIIFTIFLNLNRSCTKYFFSQ